MSTPRTTAAGSAIASALAHSDTLADLLRRVDASRRRLAAVTELLPPPLRPAVRAGPLDDAHWTLLADDPAAAAKLRQLKPALEAALQAAGWPTVALRVKVARGG